MHLYYTYGIIQLYACYNLPELSLRKCENKNYSTLCQKQTVADVCQIALNIADLIQCCLIRSVYDTCMYVCLYLLYILRTLAL